LVRGAYIPLRFRGDVTTEAHGSVFTGSWRRLWRGGGDGFIRRYRWAALVEDGAGAEDRNSGQ
jgi:hypothetical protein